MTDPTSLIDDKRPYFYIAANRVSDDEVFPCEQKYANCWLVQKILPGRCTQFISEHATKQEAMEETRLFNDAAQSEVIIP